MKLELNFQDYIGFGNYIKYQITRRRNLRDCCAQLLLTKFFFKNNGFQFAESANVVKLNDLEQCALLVLTEDETDNIYIINLRTKIHQQLC